jgi:tetratricopeptide (TPR) repeat protein
MSKSKQIIALSLLTLTFAVCVSAQQGTPGDAAALIKQAQQLESDGKRKEALGMFPVIVEKDPANVAAHLGMGRVLNIEGQYVEARQHFQKAIDAASPSELNGALSAMAISYAFEGKAADAAKYYGQLIDRQLASGATDAAGGAANGLARVYLETGDTANAEKWYRTGYETALKNPKRTPEQTDLTEMRWHHAQARIAARRKQFDVARKHVDEVRALVAAGRLDEAQQAQYPHVAGYVAFYAGESDKAIAELSKADQEDPFILSLLAQAYEQKRDVAKARELYTKILAMPAYSLQAAFARPLAARRLAAR